MSVHMQWNLPADAGSISYSPAALEDDIHGVRMTTTEGRYMGEELVVYGNVTDLRAWHDRIGVVLDRIAE